MYLKRDLKDLSMFLVKLFNTVNTRARMDLFHYEKQNKQCVGG